MGLIVLRCVFLMVSAGLAVHFINNLQVVPADSAWLQWAVFFGVLAVSVGIITADVSLRRKRLDVITAVYFGLIIGLFMTYILGLALVPLQLGGKSQAALQLLLAAALCYVCISVLLQTRNDFRFIIPYVEFVKEVKGSRPCILDTSVVIDGRIADIVQVGVFDGKLVMPQFVISELQGIADSSDRSRRSRGRRGLDILNRLRTIPQVDLEVFERELPEFADQPVDLKLVALARHLEGKLITNDYNLNKVASLQGVSVINLNDLANAMKPSFVPGEQIEVRVVKPGEEIGQGVGYLEDGTMVVVEGGRDHLQKLVLLSVTSVLQTSAGRMVFGRFESERHESASPSPA